MDKEMKEKWIKALRSGKYKQCAGVLYHNNHYCCLGVLCDLHNSSLWKNTTTPLGKSYLGVTRTLPEEISIKYNIAHWKILAIMNDDGKSFEEIAQYIEENM